MSKHTFTRWLRSEVTSASYALLTLYEQRDKLKFIDGPRLEKAYMEQVGTYEETVIKEEIECDLVRKKQQMIQTAINRNEPVDEKKIDAQIEQLRQETFKEAAGSQAPSEFAELSGDQSSELQSLYREIVKKYHPETHPELTQVHRELFQRAQEAYRLRDLSALQLIYDMLRSADEDGSEMGALIGIHTELVQDEPVKQEAPAKDYETDYALAALVYRSFKPTGEEAAISEEWSRYKQKIDGVMREMERTKQEFPYSAADMLSDPTKLEAYKEELAHRLRSAAMERERRAMEIARMLEGVNFNE